MPDDLLGIDVLQRDLREFASAARHLDIVSSNVELRSGDLASLAAGVLEIERAIDAQSKRFSKNAEMKLIWRELRDTRIAALRKRFKKLAEGERREGGRGRRHRKFWEPMAVTD